MGVMAQTVKGASVVLFFGVVMRNKGEGTFTLNEFSFEVINFQPDVRKITRIKR